MPGTLAFFSPAARLREPRSGSPSPGEQIVIRAEVNQGQPFVQVIDAGIGIAPDHLPQLFDRFYRVDTARTRAHGGAGLGLSIVKAIVEAHGGTVSVESKLGAGSTFTLRLPAHSGGSGILV